MRKISAIANIIFLLNFSIYAEETQGPEGHTETKFSLEYEPGMFDKKKDSDGNFGSWSPYKSADQWSISYKPNCGKVPSSFSVLSEPIGTFLEVSNMMCAPQIMDINSSLENGYGNEDDFLFLKNKKFCDCFEEGATSINSAKIKFEHLDEFDDVILQAKKNIMRDTYKRFIHASASQNAIKDNLYLSYLDLKNGKQEYSLLSKNISQLAPGDVHQCINIDSMIKKISTQGTCTNYKSQDLAKNIKSLRQDFKTDPSIIGEENKDAALAGIEISPRFVIEALESEDSKKEVDTTTSQNWLVLGMMRNNPGGTNYLKTNAEKLFNKSREEIKQAVKQIISGEAIAQERGMQILEKLHPVVRQETARRGRDNAFFDRAKQIQNFKEYHLGVFPDQIKKGELFSVPTDEEVEQAMSRFDLFVEQKIILESRGNCKAATDNFRALCENEGMLTQNVISEVIRLSKDEDYLKKIAGAKGKGDLDEKVASTSNRLMQMSCVVHKSFKAPGNNDCKYLDSNFNIKPKLLSSFDNRGYCNTTTDNFTEVNSAAMENTAAQITGQVQTKDSTRSVNTSGSSPDRVIEAFNNVENSSNITKTSPEMIGDIENFDSVNIVQNTSANTGDDESADKLNLGTSTPESTENVSTVSSESTATFKTTTTSETSGSSQEEDSYFKPSASRTAQVDSRDFFPEMQNGMTSNYSNGLMQNYPKDYFGNNGYYPQVYETTKEEDITAENLEPPISAKVEANVKTGAEVESENDYQKYLLEQLKIANQKNIELEKEKQKLEQEKKDKEIAKLKEEKKALEEKFKASQKRVAEEAKANPPAVASNTEGSKETSNNVSQQSNPNRDSGTLSSSTGSSDSSASQAVQSSDQSTTGGSGGAGGATGTGSRGNTGGVISGPTIGSSVGAVSIGRKEQSVPLLLREEVVSSAIQVKTDDDIISEIQKNNDLPVIVTVDGNAVFQYDFDRDSDGEVLIDKNGKPMLKAIPVVKKEQQLKGKSPAAVKKTNKAKASESEKAPARNYIRVRDMDKAIDEEWPKPQ